MQVSHRVGVWREAARGLRKPPVMARALSPLWLLLVVKVIGRAEEQPTRGLASPGAEKRDPRDPHGSKRREFWQGHWHPGMRGGCDCARARRIGPDGDGGKMVCVDAVPAPPEACLVVSVGVGGLPGQPPDFRFETALHARFPHCEIETWDGTNFGRGSITNAPSFVRFRAENFSPRSFERYVGRRVDILKIDCEGCEFDCLPPFVARVLTRQVLVEVHSALLIQGEFFGHRPHWLMKHLNETAYGLFYREPNIFPADGTNIEFALLRRREAPFQENATRPDADGRARRAPSRRRHEPP